VRPEKNNANRDGKPDAINPLLHSADRALAACLVHKLLQDFAPAAVDMACNAEPDRHNLVKCTCARNAPVPKDRPFFTHALG
jgi:hypothetical protein